MIVLLTGCTSAEQPEPTPPPTPTPSPTAAPQGDPWSTLPVECSDIVDQGDAATMTGAPVELNDELQGSIDWAAKQQLGVLQCMWSEGHWSGSESSAPSVLLSVFRDTQSDFSWDGWQFYANSSEYPEGSTASRYHCSVAVDGSGYCQFVIDADGYWAQGDLITAAGSQDAASMEASTRGLIDAVTAAIDGAGPARDAWVIPEGSLTGAYCDTREPRVVYTEGQPLDLYSATLKRSALVRCSEPSPRIDIDVLPGGAWALPLADGKASGYKLPPYSVQNVDGVGDILVSCNFGCSALVAVGESLVHVYAFYDVASDVTTFAPLLKTSLDGIEAAG